MTSPAKPVVAHTRPFYRELKAGRTYMWCQCGRSVRQPFCDGRSHIGTGFEPVAYTARADGEEVLFCGCKQTGTPPFCDGAHNNLPGGYKADARSEAELEALAWAETDEAGFRRLDDRCYVVSPAATRPASPPRFWCRTIVSPALGAAHQSQFYLELESGSSPVLSAGAADAILWISAGAGTATIAGHDFSIQAEDGVHVRAGEAFRIACEGSERLVAFVSTCPAVDALEELDAMPETFDARFPERICGVDPSARSAMGPRYFQMLVDKKVGSTTAAQFIGHIPASRGEMHRHLYEEALIIMAGTGVIWNERSRAKVAAGDVIFFPRKHAHSLESIGGGMDVVGLIHPGDNPGINY